MLNQCENLFIVDFIMQQLIFFIFERRVLKNKKLGTWSKRRLMVWKTEWVRVCGGKSAFMMTRGEYISWKWRKTSISGSCARSRARKRKSKYKKNCRRWFSATQSEKHFVENVTTIFFRRKKKHYILHNWKADCSISWFRIVVKHIKFCIDIDVKYQRRFKR